MSSTSQLTNIYLTKESGELVVRQGCNPNIGKHADKRVLVVGGGVTGLTVSPYIHCNHLYADNRLERMGSAGRRIPSHRRLRPLGITRQSHHFSDCRCPVRLRSRLFASARILAKPVRFS